MGLLLPQYEIIISTKTQFCREFCVELFKTIIYIYLLYLHF